MEKYLILGGGIAGIGAASILKEEALVIEKNEYLGGLCSSFKIGDYTFDRAIHLSFSNDEFAKSCFNMTVTNSHKAVPYNFNEGKWIKHPVQFNLFDLDTDTKIDIIDSFAKKRVFETPDNYREWLVSNYGEIFTDLYPEKYTRKYWCKNSSEMSVDWITGRMAPIDLKDILRGALSKDTGHNYYLNEIIYPRKGGFGSFINPLIEDIRYQLNSKIIEIDLDKKVVTLNTGELISYEILINSLPITELVKMLKFCPEEVKMAASKLEYTWMYIASVGFKNKTGIDYPWYYVYDEDIISARIYSTRWKSEQNVPQGADGIQMELHFHNSQFDESDSNEENFITKNVYYSLEKLGYDISDIVFVDIKKEPYANIIYTTDMLENRSIILDYLEKQGVKGIGRFGSWSYLWSDQSLMSGVKCANQLKEGK